MGIWMVWMVVMVVMVVRLSKLEIKEWDTGLWYLYKS